MAETLWTEDLEPEDLFEVISQSLVNAFDRDAGSGWGAVVTIIEPHQVCVQSNYCLIIRLNNNLIIV